MKVAVVLGTRPEIVKLAPVIRACLDRGWELSLTHTGQHYSAELDAVFFEELELPAPDHRLEVGSCGDVEQLTRIVHGADRVLAAERPDVVLVQGDTNSVLAGALAARRNRIPVGHVEAGLRSWDPGMPEEINRRFTDHLADQLFAPTPATAATLKQEGIPGERIHVTGNTVVDELRRQRERAEARGAAARFGVEPGRYAVATVHRRENVEDPLRLAGIFEGLAGAGRDLGLVVLVALHPRTSQRLAELGLQPADPVRLLPPLGYLDFLGLHAEAALTLTDSGGLQEEACCLGVACVTLRDNTERPESVEVGANLLAGADPARIRAAAREMAGRRAEWPNPFGDGVAGSRILDLLAP